MDRTCFWVVGGEYTDTDFARLVEGTGQVYGPFDSYEEARAVWERQSLATRCRALMRFAIARDGPAR
ncbi:MAG: hypothetical protein IRY94_09290 [Rhodospirillaceae bacterium]|nr:hypothetical protein [Rhodospirillaceae bacterium]